MVARTPKMPPAEYHRRRQKLMSMMECGTVAVLEIKDIDSERSVKTMCSQRCDTCLNST